MDPFIYQYTVGGVILLAGLGYAWRQGYVGLQGKPLRNLLMVLGGLVFFAAIQGTLQYAPMTEAPPGPPSTESLPEGRLGTGLDYAIMVGYFLTMLAVGTWFGRKQRSTKDFFFGGQRFSWWLIAFSLVATTIGSYSFVKYSKIAYTWGIASSQTYLNDWLWIPFLLFGWVPILYFSRVISIPEYFERRFNRPARVVSTWLLLVYLVGYVGINLFTMGQALNILLGWPVLVAAALVASVSAVYVTFGGQTSVIMTDLFQGVMLLATGLLLLALGVAALGGIEPFWEHLPRGHRMAFPPFNADPSYPAVGVFYQDAIANSAMFYFLNQGMVMRLMAARTVEDSRKAMISMLLVLMPIAAVVVASGGWVGRALVHAGVLPELPPKEAFFITAEFLSQPGVFGLIMASLTAALMSTVDTLITAIAAIVVNDVYRPMRPDASDKQLLRVARFSSVGITLLGVALVPVFASFGSIYSAHGAFTAAVTPPLVVALLLGVFWRRFTPAAAVATMAGGAVVIAVSLFVPQIIAPVAHGVPMIEPTGEFLSGMDSYKFMRALFGLLSCLVIGVGVSLVTRPRPLDEVRGLVWGTVADAIRHFKGKPGSETESAWVRAVPRAGEDETLRGPGQLPTIALSAGAAAALEAEADDLVFVTDDRWWLGGLRASHAVVGEVFEGEAPEVVLAPVMFEDVVGTRTEVPVRLKRLY